MVKEFFKKLKRKWDIKSLQLLVMANKALTLSSEFLEIIRFLFMLMFLSAVPKTAGLFP